ncbi:Holliday junction resolvase RuvX [soil metagenome]
MQEKQTINYLEFADVAAVPKSGRIVALDPGTKRIGVAITDETQMLARPLKRIERTSWKKLLLATKDILAEYDAVALVIGLPLESNGDESAMSSEARRMARNYSFSLEVPVLLQDERVSSYDAKGRLWDQGKDLAESRDLVDSEAAVIILEDFLASRTRSIN